VQNGLDLGAIWPDGRGAFCSWGFSVSVAASLFSALAEGSSGEAHEVFHLGREAGEGVPLFSVAGRTVVRAGG